MKLFFLGVSVFLVVVGSFVTLRLLATQPALEPDVPLAQPVWKSKPSPRRPAPAQVVKRTPVVNQTPGIKTYKAGEMIDLGKTRFGDKSETRGPIHASRRAYDMDYSFQQSSARNEAPIQTQRGSNGRMQSQMNR